MAVQFKIEFVSRDGSPVMTELLEKKKVFWSTKNMRLGGVPQREGFSAPRAHDPEGNLRYDKSPTFPSCQIFEHWTNVYNEVIFLDHAKVSKVPY